METGLSSRIRIVLLPGNCLMMPTVVQHPDRAVFYIYNYNVEELSLGPKEQGKTSVIIAPLNVDCCD
jgi:hypothetical protein